MLLTTFYKNLNTPLLVLVVLQPPVFTKHRRCGLPKPIKAAPKPTGKGMRPGDWICPACNNHNYAVPWIRSDAGG